MRFEELQARLRKSNTSSHYHNAISFETNSDDWFRNFLLGNIFYNIDGAIIKIMKSRFSWTFSNNLFLLNSFDVGMCFISFLECFA